MTKYRIEHIGIEWHVMNECDQFVGGPYADEAKAKRRIRDLKRKDMEQKAQINQPFDVMDTIDPNYAESFERPMRNDIRYAANAVEGMVNRPNGVYPHVAKKFYRAQWRV